MPRLTQAAFAQHVGVTQSAIQRAVAHGILDMKKGIDQNRIDYCAHLRAVASGHHSDDGQLDVIEEKALLARSSRILNEQKIAQNEGQLIPLEEVSKEWVRHAMAAKSAILGVPARIASSLVGLDDPRVAYEIVHDEVTAALHFLADASNKPAVGKAGYEKYRADG